MTQRNQIDRLAALYNLFIDSHFVPNILEEIYSTFQLLTVKEAKDVQKLQGQSWQTGFFKLALRDRNMQVRFFWKVVLKF